MLRFLSTHLFEAAALTLTCGAALNYAVGRSYLEGWAEVAGVPPRLYPVDLYETILAGVQLSGVWRTAGLVLGCAMAYLWATIALPEWWARRRETVGRRKRFQDGWDHLGVRERFAHAARKATKGKDAGTRVSIAEIWRWRVLGRRGKRREELVKLAHRRRKAPSTITLICILAFSVATTVTGAYLVVYWMLLQPARNDGARDSVKMILAVTGRFPFQYEGVLSHTSREDLREWACDGRKMLMRYRSVRLPSDELTRGSGDGGASDSSPGPPMASYYLLQGSDKIFVLLGVEGTVIKSFGDAPFVLHESPIRPLSETAGECQPSE